MLGAEGSRVGGRAWIYSTLVPMKFRMLGYLSWYPKVDALRTPFLTAEDCTVHNVQ